MTTREQLCDLINNVVSDDALTEIEQAIHRIIEFYSTSSVPTPVIEPIILKARMLPPTIRPDFEPDLED
jgi:hypothetical protein